MGLFSSNNGYTDKDIEKMTKGWKSNVELPEYDTNHPFIGVGGGKRFFAAAPLNITKKRKILTKVAVRDKGILIMQGQIDGKDLRIPWENIVNVGSDLLNIIISLTDGDIIKLSATPWGISKKNVIKYLNTNATGKIENGWDSDEINNAQNNFCTSCGTKLNNNSNFCSNCGAKL